MCRGCIETSNNHALSRHEFLRLGLLAGTGTMLTACGLGGLAGLPAPGPTVSPTAPTLLVSNAYPQLAGELTAVSEANLTLRSASRSRIFPLMADTLFYSETGALIDPGLLALNQNAAVRLQGEAISVLQVLPALAHIAVDSALLPQLEPTGETVAIGSLTMTTRAGWGAAAPDLSAPAETGLFDPDSNPEGWLTYTEPLAEVLNTVVLHHSAGSFVDGAREIQRFHRVRRGYADIAYHYVIDGFGDLFEGRKLTERGAHTGGANTGTIGVVLLGDFSRITVLRSQLQTATTLIAWLASEYGITHVAGHRDFQPGITECPGNHLEEWLPALAEATGLVVGTGGYVMPSWVR